MGAIAMGTGRKHMHRPLARRSKWLAAMSLCLSLALPLIASTAFSGSVRVPGAAGDIEVSVISFKERQYQTILRQEYDYSCGSAALASLLTFHYENPVSEKAVFDAMLETADRQKVFREGFSMLDMKRYLEARGYRADGFRMPLDGLRHQVAIPVIVLMNIDGFRHFVVLKGISDEEVLVGDPARGLKTYARSDFEAGWDGVAFVIRNHLELGRASFNQREEWQQVARAPVSSYSGAGSLALGDILLNLPMGLDW